MAYTHLNCEIYYCTVLAKIVHLLLIMTKGGMCCPIIVFSKDMEFT